MIWNEIKGALQSEWKATKNDKSTELFMKEISNFLEANFGYFYHCEKSSSYNNQIWRIARKQEELGNFSSRDAAFLFLTTEVVPSISLLSFEKHGLTSWRHIGLMIKSVVDDEPSLKYIDDFILAIDRKMQYPSEYLDEYDV